MYPVANIIIIRITRYNRINLFIQLGAFPSQLILDFELTVPVFRVVVPLEEQQCRAR